MSYSWFVPHCWLHPVKMSTCHNSHAKWIFSTQVMTNCTATVRLDRYNPINLINISECGESQTVFKVHSHTKPEGWIMYDSKTWNLTFTYFSKLEGDLILYAKLITLLSAYYVKYTVLCTFSEVYAGVDKHILRARDFTHPPSVILFIYFYNIFVLDVFWISSL